MDSIKYIGREVHKDAIVIAVLKDNGKLVMESIIETKASTILQLIQGLRGGLLRPVYHGENGIRTLQELSRSYLTISKVSPG